MIKDLSSLTKLFGEAQNMQKKISEIQEEMGKKTLEVSTGGGMVNVLINGNQQILKIDFDENIMSTDPKMFKDLLISAINEAIKKSKDLAQDEMKKLAGGFNIPNLKNLFNK